MLDQLHISNFALIDQIDFDLGEGLNIITGETGSGKSIMMDALTLLRGDRADTSMIGPKGKKAVVEGYFTCLPQSCLDFLAQNDIELDKDGVCVMRREISSTAGRSRAFINDTQVTLDKLGTLAKHLVDIHSQHNNLLLEKEDFMREILDNLADNHELLKRMAQEYAEFDLLKKQYKAAKEQYQQQKDNYEYDLSLKKELEEFKLQPGEHESLEQEREILANMSQIKERLAEATEALDVITRLKKAAGALSALEGTLDESAELGQRLESAIVEIKDIADTVTDIDAGLNGDPQQLQEVETRLTDLYALERKHKVENSDQLLEILNRLRNELKDFEDSPEMINELYKKTAHAKKKAQDTAEEISSRRKKAAEEFSHQLVETAKPMNMKNLSVEIRFTPTKLSKDGVDTVTLMCSFNKNQPMMPASETASGGEISRLMLAIKSLKAKKMAMPTIIFDEIDTGVSGDVALRMGDLMCDISQWCQVIAITHLPAVAAKGSRHFKVYKEDSDTETNTHITLLNRDERIGEIATMLSGNPDNEKAREAAKDLLSPRLDFDRED